MDPIKRLLNLAALLLLVCSVSVSAQSQLPYQDESLPAETRVKDLVGRMTLEEKVMQTVNAAPAIPRLGIPAYDWWNEGLHGVARSGYATLFPQAVGMAATFDEPLIGKIGEVISVEARAKYNEAARHNIHAIYYGLTIWSPNINIFRDPRWGRGQETYGEDPFLTARLGTAFVKSLQGTDPTYDRVIATPKHFAVHSGPEEIRHKFNIDPSPHDLWDTYLPAFRSTIVDGKAGSIMCAYNAINGKPACASDLLLQDILRRQWNFRGFVTSDCGAIDDFYMSYGHHFAKTAEEASIEALRAGTDTNCGKTYKVLAKAVQQGLVQESEIDVAVQRLFLARFKLGLFDSPAKVKYASLPFSEVNSPAHAAVALQAAREAVVLLKNNGVLPLKSSGAKAVKTIAVIGPNAAELNAIEGNYNAVPKDPVLPVDGIATAFPSAKILYAQGSPYAENAPIVIPRTQFHTGDSEGLAAEYFSNDSFSGKPAVRRVDKQVSFDWNSASPDPEKLNPQTFSVRWTGTLTAPAPGDYEIHAKLAICDSCDGTEKLAIRFDGKEVADFDTGKQKAEHDSSKPHVTLHFSDTNPHAVEFSYAHNAKLFGAGITLSWVPPVQPLLQQALDVVKHADVTIAFVGLSPDLEGEALPLHIPGFNGGDRTDIGLPVAQQQLLEAVKATGKPLVVVLMNGSALAVNWANEHADAILEAWYPGQGGSQAIAESLNGRNNPGGRLPVTFYSGVEDLPPFTDYSMANRTYRYYKGKPLFGFGYGLSYTSFAYSKIKLSTDHLQAGDTLRVEADVKNTGKLAGDEVAELYLTPPQNGIFPIHTLQGFQRIHLAPGKSQHLIFELSPRQLSLVEASGVRAVRDGVYHVSVGGSQPVEGDSSARSFTIAGTQELAH